MNSECSDMFIKWAILQSSDIHLNFLVFKYFLFFSYYDFKTYARRWEYILFSLCEENFIFAILQRMKRPIRSSVHTQKRKRRKNQQIYLYSYELFKRSILIDFESIEHKSSAEFSTKWFLCIECTFIQQRATFFSLTFVIKIKIIKKRKEKEIPSTKVRFIKIVLKFIELL